MPKFQIFAILTNMRFMYGALVMMMTTFEESDASIFFWLYQLDYSIF